MYSRFARQSIFWLCLLSCQAFAFDDTRLYSGEIEVPGTGAVDMTLGVSDTEDGLFLLLTVPMQSTKNTPLPAIYNSDGALVSTVEQAGLVITVMENSDFTRLQGRLEQMGLVFPIDFERVTEVPILKRPQTPVEPFSYHSREVVALHPDGHLLAGTLTIPEGKGPFPCAVLISGSGQQDRNETLMGHQPFLVIADDLTRKGIAVLRFDDRGVGGSTMEHPQDIRNATSEDFATDVAVMVHAARIHPEVDARRVGVIGHSEGGLIGPMVAVEDEDLAFVAMLAGPGVPGFELLPLQQKLLLQSTNIDPELIDEVVNASMTLFELMARDASEEELHEQIIELIEVSFLAQGMEIPQDNRDDIFETAIEEMTQPWLQFFLFYDPAPVLARVKCPVLAMNGTLDLQVPSKQNLPAIESAIRNAGGTVTIVELEGLNHLFQFATTGAIGEYAQIETTIDPIALEVLSEWLLEVTDDD